jgi:hypothetical protein
VILLAANPGAKTQLAFFNTFSKKVWEKKSPAKEQ